MNGSEHLPEHATADAGSALDVAGIAAVLRKHLWSDPRSWRCVCGWKAGNGWEEAPAQSRVEQRLAHIAEAVAAHVEALREADRAGAVHEVISALEDIYPSYNYELRYDGTEDPIAAAYVEAFRDIDATLARFRAARSES